jgi:branched-chain amino acid aminotransferase
MATPPFNDRDGYIWQDGKFIDWRSAQLHVLTHGLHYASSVFEGLRAYNGKIFKLKEHTARLFRSAELLNFEIPYSADVLNAAQEEILKKNNITNGYIRPVAWRGSEMMAISAKGSTVHVAIAAWEWPSYFSKEAKEKGLRLTLAKYARPSPNTAITESKAAGLYMICTVSKQIADAKGYDDALMLDYRGYLAELTGANLFLIQNGELHTPLPDCFLNGITRQTVMDLARARGIKVVERHIQPEELASTQEVFVTGSAAEVTPIGAIDGLPCGNFSFTVGPVTKQLMADYTALVNG